MIYTLEEKQQMERLLLAFSGYIAKHPTIDAAYSDKTGYVMLSIGKSTDHLYFEITGFEDMAKMFVHRYLLDEEFRAGGYLDMDYELVRKQLALTFAAMEDQHESCLQLMDREILNWQKHCEQLYKELQKDLASLRKFLAARPESEAAFQLPPGEGIPLPKSRRSQTISNDKTET